MAAEPRLSRPALHAVADQPVSAGVKSSGSAARAAAAAAADSLAAAGTRKLPHPWAYASDAQDASCASLAICLHRQISTIIAGSWFR